MSKLTEMQKICDDFKARQEELWYMREDFVTSTVKDLEELMPCEDDGSNLYIEVMATYEALKDESEGIGWDTII